MATLTSSSQPKIKYCPTLMCEKSKRQDFMAVSKIAIIKGLSDSCTEPLLQSLVEMTHNISHNIIIEQKGRKD